MKLLSKKKIYYILIYLCIIFLIVICCYDIFLYFSKKNSNKVPFNAIRVSPITGEHIVVSNTKMPLVHVIYDSDNFDKLPYIKYADITVEKYNFSKKSFDYAAYLYDKKIMTNSNIKSIKSLSVNNFPKINFSSSTSNINTTCSNILINYPDNMYTSFNYISDHYKKSNTISPNYSNVVIQYISSDVNIENIFDKSFYGILFSKGIRSEFKYDGKKFNFINNNTPGFIEGKTYWIAIPENINVKLS